MDVKQVIFCAVCGIIVADTYLDKPIILCTLRFIASCIMALSQKICKAKEKKDGEHTSHIGKAMIMVIVVLSVMAFVGFIITVSISDVPTIEHVKAIPDDSIYIMKIGFGLLLILEAGIIIGAFIDSLKYHEPKPYGSVRMEDIEMSERMERLKHSEKIVDASTQKF